MQIAQVFINEHSWNIDGYDSPEQLAESVANFQQIFSYLSEKSKEYKELSVFYKGESVKAFLRDLVGFEIQDIKFINELFEKRSEDWQDSQLHKAQDTYYKLVFKENNLTNFLEYITGTSLAEISERKIQNNHFALLLLNFTQSTKGLENFAHIIKNAYNALPTLVHITQIDSLQRVKEWFSLEVELRNLITDASMYETIKLAYQTQKFNFETWKPNENYLPLASVSDLLVKGDWQKFRQEIKEKESEKMAIISEMGRQVALLNGYSYSKEISDLNKSNNKKREIYEAGDGREKIYLSCDFESGGFEICDFSGTHLGEFGFHGRKTSEAKLDHSIKIK